MILTSDPHRYVLMTDISEHQRGARVEDYAAAGFGIISLRSQFGARFIDRQFDTFAAASVAGGLKRLYYVWVLPGDSAAAHVGLMREAVRRHGSPELGWMLDVEDTENASKLTRDQYRALVLELRNAAVEMSGKLPVIYTAGWYWDRWLRDVDDFADCPLIVASYPFQRQDGSESKPHPTDVRAYGSWAFAAPFAADRAVPRSGGWETWQGWQYTSLAGLTVPGFAHRGVRGLDMNLLRPEWVAQRTGAQFPGTTRPTVPTVPPPLPVPVTPPTLEDLMQPRFLRSDGAQFLLGPNGDDKIPVSPAWADLATAAGGPLVTTETMNAAGVEGTVDDKLAGLADGYSVRDVGGIVSAQVQAVVREESAATETALLGRLDQTERSIVQTVVALRHQVEALPAPPASVGGDVVLRIEAVRQ